MGIYDPSILGAPGNQVVFNDDSAGVDPYYRVQRRRPQNRDVRNFDTPLPEDNGIADFKTLLGRTDYILDGKMYPSNQSFYEQGRRALRMVADVKNNQEDPLTDQGYVPYQWDETDQPKRMMVKVLFVDLVEDTQYGLVQPFRIYCKVKHPIIQGTVLRIADTGAQPGVIVGFVGYPLEYPALIGKNFYEISSTATNEGDIAAYPESIIITGPVNRPRFTNATTGDFIEVDVNLASTDDQLVMAYDQDSISITLNGVSVFNKLSADSTLFQVPPGPNNFILSGSSIGTGASAVISFYDAFPLS